MASRRPAAHWELLSSFFDLDGGADRRDRSARRSRRRRADVPVTKFWCGYGPRITHRVPITWTPCALGGRRPWFCCEARRNGSYCGRRVALLYSTGGGFACRHCHDLSYQSQSETPRLRSIRRVREIRMRLGAGFSFAEPFPDKPPGMHWKTYGRLLAAARDAELPVAARS